MKTIINNSNHVITVNNSYFSKDIAIGEKLILMDEEINNDFVLKFKFFSLKERKENKIEEVRTFGNRFGLWASSTLYVPVQTELCSQQYDQITIELKEDNFIFITKLFKKICLQIPNTNNTNAKVKHSFINPDYTKKFKSSIVLELIVTIPILLMLLNVSIISYIEALGWFESLTLSILTIFSIYSNIRKIYYLTKKFK